MNRLFIILSLVFIISCNHTVETKDVILGTKNSKTLQVTLIDSLGTIILSVPLRYDTNFSWLHYSDCGKPCDEQKYRFQSKGLPIMNESGFIWPKMKDSVDRITISHTLDFPFHDGDTTRNTIVHAQLKEQLVSNPENPPIIFDTLQKINDRYFSIFEMEKSDSIQRKKVVAITTIKSNIIKFQYELLTRTNDLGTKNFIKNSVNLIMTIRISNGM